MSSQLKQSPRTLEEMASPLLFVKDLCLRYEEHGPWILRHIDFVLHPGESVLLLGPSGSGKSTLAMVLADLIPGILEAEVKGEVFSSDSLRKPGNIGYVFQDADTQFCMLQVDDELAFGMENRQIPRAKMRERMKEALANVLLPVAPNDHHHEFSGGMKQKLAIASALTLRPQLCVLDEPTANLDPLASAQVLATIQKLREQGTSLLIIEHHFQPLLPYVDRVVLFNRDGSIHRQGPAGEVVAEEWAWMLAEGVAESHELVQTAVRRANDASSLSLGNPLWTLSGLDVKRGKREVLKQVNAEIRQGEWIAIVGPNGSGKSTLLEALAGLVPAESGELSYAGRPLKDWSAEELYQRISVSFQNPEHQFVYERVGEEIANQRLSGDIPDDVQSWLSDFGLAGLAEQSPYMLSQGQKRRLSVASMLRKEHEAYLLDEPTFGQDAATTRFLMERLESLHIRGKTLIMVSHDLSLVYRYATRVWVVVNGRLIWDGLPQDLKNHQAIRAKAHLLSEQELIAAELQRTELSMKDIWNAWETKSVPKNHARLSWFRKIHPVWLFIGILVAAVLMVFANNWQQGLAMLLFPMVLLMTLGHQSPWRVLKILAPFVLIYFLSLVSLTLNSAVPSGSASLTILWWHPSIAGLLNGIVLATRMIGTLALGLLYVDAVDLTELTIGLTRHFRLPPKFAYGFLAGFRILPLLHTEWNKIQDARRVRGLSPKRMIWRIGIFALPLLAQAVRMSERVAMAMEARGLQGDAAASAKERSFYRDVSYGTLDIFIALAFPVSVFALLMIFAHP